LESFNCENTILPTAIPAANSSIQAASTHRRRLTQKRAMVANMSASLRQRLPGADLSPVEHGQPPMRVLLVDDHEISRAAVSALLRTQGAEVADLATGEAALAVAIAFRPAVAIIDVTPADATGFRIADLLRALPGAPAVVLTSSADRRRFASRLGTYRFVAKADLCVQNI